MIRKLILTLATLAASAHAAGVVITELHRDPAAGNKNAIPGGYSHTFIELANFGSDTFFLRDVFLTNGKVVDSIMLFGGAVPIPTGHGGCVFDAAYIPPGGIAVILPQNYPAGLEAAPVSILPIAPGTIMLTVNHKNIGGGMANDDGVAVYKGTRARVDSLVDIAADPGIYVSAPLSGKILLSRKQPKGVSVVPASLLLGDRKYIVSPKEPLSPGRYESFQNGLLAEHSANMVSGMAVRCSIAGIFVTEDSDDVPWRFYSRLPSSANSGATEIGSGVFGQQRDFLLTFDITPEQRRYFFEIRLAGSKMITFPIDLSTFWADAGTLLITELYPKGSATADQPEWFELQNVSAAEVNMNGWMFGNSKDTAVITSADFFLPPGEFLVVCKDSAAMLRKYRAIRNLIRPARWHTLGSSNDTLAVWSPRGIEVDRAAYRSAWFTGWKTQSLERVLNGKSGADPESWVLCDRPTPGAPGGAGQWRAVSAPSLDIGPTPFRPNGEGIDAVLSIRMKIPPGTKAKIKIFGFDGKLLKTFTGEREQVNWDGATDTGRPAAPGPIYVIAEFTAPDGARRVMRKNGVLWR